MVDWKSIAILAAAVVLGGVRVVAAADGTKPVPPGVVQTDAHTPVTYHFTITNTTDKPQTVESVRTSCACLKVKMGGSQFTATETDAINCVPPGSVLSFEVVFNPAGMEGHIEKRVWVTLAPSGRIETFDVAADVRLRLGFKPMDAAFGVIRRSETDREIVAKLSGYAADGVMLGMPFISAQRGDLAAKNANGTKNKADNKTELTGLERNLVNPVNPVKTNLCAEKKDAVFDVRLVPDGKSLVVKFRERNVLPGIYTETWTIATSDPEIPEITFPVSARVADAVTVTPQVITVGWDEPVCSRFVTIRADARLINPDNPVNPVRETLRASASPRENLTVISAETKPRKWGDVTITQRPMNGWRIDIANIDPREVRQFSKRPFLEVKTNLPGMESFEIPLRVVNDGGAK